MEDANEVLGLTDLYTHHLCLGHFGRQWAAQMRHEAERESGSLDAEYLKGYAQALEDIVQHLEAGEGLPGGPLYARIAERFATGEHSRT
ncbi:hypothetical protein [Mobilicoccus caccae]|uniref:Uncharacterized protein n=1 Tax=Mobilicoccus caccae TaxID=1859295 RepID=A0ABQ6ITV3_9MICO|nr:hypothetical protein [Mobilicoccus caccae]GMA41360.1 hypothetical protein GCM10025883_34050 [Mobilicoccus caccae]